MSLSNYENIELTANKLIEFRLKYESKDKDEQEIYLTNYFKENFDEYESWENATEYTDNIIRYFRLTRYFYIRGNGWYIDLEPRRIIEINALIENDNASAKVFTSKDEYISYLSDVNTPTLP